MVGGGPAGYATALYGASAGLKIALVEKEKVGGTCLHRGCIPAKELLESAHVFRTVAHASTFGVNAGAPTIDWSVTMKRKQQVVDTQWKGLESTIRGRKIEIVPGTGRFLGNGVVEVTAADGAVTTLQGANVVLAPGSVPRTIPGFEVDGRYVLTRAGRWLFDATGRPVTIDLRPPDPRDARGTIDRGRK